MHSSARHECPRQLIAPPAGQLSSRWASAADLARYYGKRLEDTVHARIILLDEAPIAVVGISRQPAGLVGETYVPAHYLFFSEYRPDARELLPRVPVMRAVKRVIDLVKGQRLRVLSITEEVDGPRVLERLGFVPVPGAEGVFVWPN